MIRDPKKLCGILVLAVGFSAIAAGDAHAYRLPPYRISPQEMARPAEKNLARYKAALDGIQAHVPLGVAATRRRDYKVRLTPSQRRAAAKYDEAKVAFDFWAYVVDLKRQLIALHADARSGSIADEADAMAKAVVQRIYDISQKYRIFLSALVQNMLVNTGKRDKGHCYHYVSDIRKALRKRSWKHFDLLWGEAWPDTYRENNALVVTAADMPFDTGLAIDAWRTGGKPFWTKVAGDRFPWKDGGHVEIIEK